MLRVVFLCSALLFMSLCLGIASLPPLTLSPCIFCPFLPLCPSLSFSLLIRFCSACPSGASRLIGLCFSLNERSVEAGWRINKFQASSHSSLSHLSSRSLSCFFLSCSAPQEGEKRDELLCLLASSSLLSCMHVLLRCHQSHKNKHLCTRISRSCFNFFFFISSLSFLMFLFRPTPAHTQLIVFWM